MLLKEWKNLKQDFSARVALFLLVAVLVWWVGLYVFHASDYAKMLWGASYQVVALWGAIWGLKIAKSWGGHRSVMGRAILAFAFGLLLQNWGQTVFFYYNMFSQVAIPYPSLADIGYFGSIPLYIYGVIMLARASGASISLRAFHNKMSAVVIPTAMLAASYLFFLRGYEFDWEAPLRVFLDFGYPLGQSIYVSLALLTYLLSRKTLGGVMRNKVLFILVALVIQYAADYNFLVQAHAETWQLSGYGDVLYLLAYFVMAIGLIQFKPSFVQTRGSATPSSD